MRERSLLIAVCLVASTATAAQHRPVRIVAGYHDLENIRLHTPARDDLYHQAFIRRQGEGRAETCSITAGELKDYCAVVFAGLTARMRPEGDSFSEEEIETVRTYLHDDTGGPWSGRRQGRETGARRRHAPAGAASIEELTVCLGTAHTHI